MSILTNASKNIINLPRFAKRIIAIIIDIGLCILSTWLAFYLRLEQFIKINDSFCLLGVYTLVKSTRGGDRAGVHARELAR